MTYFVSLKQNIPVRWYIVSLPHLLQRGKRFQICRGKENFPGEAVISFTCRYKEVTKVVSVAWTTACLQF